MTADVAMLPNAIRSEELTAVPKRVVLSRTFRDYTARLKDPDYLSDFLDLHRHLTLGIRLPERFYRSGIGTSIDFLLEKTGVKHLHLGGRNSNVLVFCVEFPTVVLILEINGHQRFDRRAVGELLVANHRVELGRIDRAA